jgi:lipopolysaccharide transport system permease protein
MKRSDSPSTSPLAIFTSVRKNRQLIWQLTRREISTRYRGSMLGFLWSLITPLLMLVVYTFVFSVVFKARWGINSDESRLEFALILFNGLIAFNLFSDVFNRAPTLILSNTNYVKKVVFPLEILPIVALGSTLFQYLVNLTVLLLVQFFVVYSLPWTILLLPVVLLPLILTCLGIGWFLSSFGVYVRDISQLTGVITTILMFTSTVFYPISALPDRYQSLLQLNPLVVIISESRKVVYYGEMPNWVSLGWVFLLGLSIAFLGFWWFQKTRRGIADVL